MNNKIEYQIFFEINENLKTASRSLYDYTKAVEFATDVCVNFGNRVSDSLNKVINDSAISMHNTSDSFGNITTVSEMASNEMENFQKCVEQLKVSFIKLTGDAAAYFSILNEYAPLISLLSGELANVAKSFNLAAIAQSVFTNVSTLVTRSLYIYQMQLLSARAAISTTTGATKAMNIAIAASPYLIAAAATAALGVALYKLLSGNSEAEKSQKRLNDAMLDMNKEIATEQLKLDTLFEPLNRAKEGTLEWNRAKDKIVSQYGDYLSKIGVEIKDVNTAREAYKLLNESILDTARSRAMEVATSGAAEAYTDKEVEGLKKIREALYDEAKSGGNINYSEVGMAFGQLKSAIRSGKDIPVEAKNILGKLQRTWTDTEGNLHKDSISTYIYDQIKKIRSARLNYENEIAQANALFGSENFRPTPTKVVTENSDKKKTVDLNSASKGSIDYKKQELSELQKQLSNTPIGIATIELQVRINDLRKEIESAEIWIEKEAFKNQHGEITVSMDLQPVGGDIIGMAERLQNDALKNSPEIKLAMMTQEGFHDIKLPELKLPNIEKPLSNIEKWNGVVGEMKEKNANMIDGLGSMGVAMGSVGELIGGAAGQWLDWGANCVQAIAAAIPQIMALCTAQGAQATANTATAGTGAAAAMSSIPIVGPILAVAAVATVLGALASIPKFAAGGLAYGPVLGIFGEYAGAQNNPEVVAPLNKLRNMLQPVGNLTGEVEFIIDGRVLRGILNKIDKINQRTK